MKICAKCLLPETFPGIRFNADGSCSHCQEFARKKGRLEEELKREKQKFIEVLRQEVHQPRHQNGKGGQHAYDVLMAYSGGRDSTYTMGLLRNKYRLRVLAVTLDNGFLSPAAVTNVRNVTENLGVDHVYFKPRWDLMKKIFTAAADRELYPKKTVERASTMCTLCIGLVTALCLKMAVEQDIPLIGFGRLPGRMSLEASLVKHNPQSAKLIQQTILNPLREIAGDEISVYFLQGRHYAAEKFPYAVHPMAWESRNEEMIVKDVRKIGWKGPMDAERGSDNCLLYAYANDVHLKRHQYHSSVWEIANMVREGIILKEAGYTRIYGQQDEHLIHAAKEKLAL